MLKVVEAFSGIGSQAKALKNIGQSFEVVNTIEWDINAIYAYDIIHNGPQNNQKYEKFSDKELKDLLSKYSISTNGKEPIKEVTFKNLKREIVIRVLSAIERTGNLVSIKDVNSSMLPNDLDIFTYSFPCQDLSISGFWHGNEGGIDRNSGNRSSMLWEVERLLLEMDSNGTCMPKFLVMENVSSIRSSRHIDNFKEWKKILEGLGYKNRVYDLSAENFGIPQRRKRTFMISVLVKEDQDKVELLEEYWKDNNLEKNKSFLPPIENFLRLNSTTDAMIKEVKESTPNNTKSRRKIRKENPIIVNNGQVHLKTVRTITTKQDRHPNSGIIVFDNAEKGKMDFRYLTPRECFLMMGFEEKDYDNLLDNNFEIRQNGQFLTRDKLNKLAGNSIVVNVMEEVFRQIIEIKNLLKI